MAKELGRTAALGLLLLYLLFGVVRPLFRQVGKAMNEIAAEGPPVAALPDQEVLQADTPDNRLESVRELARQDPKVVANVVRSWVAKG